MQCVQNVCLKNVNKLLCLSVKWVLPFGTVGSKSWCNQDTAAQRKQCLGACT